MQGTRTAILLGGLLLAMAGLAVWLLGRGSGPVDFRVSAEGGRAAALPEAGPEPEPAAPRGRAGPGRGGIAGRVVLLKSRNPVPDVVVRVSGGPEGFEPVVAVTDPDGRFRFAELPAGSGFEALVVHGEYAPVRRVGIPVAQGETMDLGTLFLERAVALLVRVMDGARKPVPGARIGVYAAEPPQMGYRPRSWVETTLAASAVPVPLRTAVADEKGEARVNDLPAGYWSVAAEADGYARAVAERLLLPETQDDPLDILLGKGFSLSGRVTDAEGKPVKGTVILSTGSQMMPGAGGVIRIAAEIDDEGRYEARSLAAGVWSLLVVREGAAPWPGGAVSVPEIREFDVSLAGGATVLGRVSEAGGKPVEGAEVRAAVWVGRGGSGQSFGAVAVSDAEGNYRLEGLPAGNLASLEVIRAGYARYPTPGTYRDPTMMTVGTEVRIDVELTRGRGLTGRVVRAGGGEPIRGATVTAIPRGVWGATGWETAISGDGGVYAFEALAAGEYVLEVQAEGFAQPGLPPPWSIQQGRGEIDARWLVRIEAGEGKMEKDLPLEAGASVSGRVEDAEGKPVSGAYVRLSTDSRREPSLTGSDGAFSFTGATPADAATVQAWAYGRWGNSDRFTVPAGGKVDSIVVRLASLGRVEGVVEIADGTAPDAGTVSAVQGDPTRNPWILNQPRQTSVPIGPDGSFALPNVPPGELTIVAEVPGFPAGLSPLLNLSGGATQPGVRIRIEAGRAIEGLVTGADGKPFAGAEISVLDPQTAWGRMGPMAAEAVVAKSGADGKFTVRGLGPGKYMVTARAEGLTPATESNVEAGSGTVLRLVLEAGGEIAGRVTDLLGGPLGGILVSLAPQGGSGGRNVGGGAQLSQTTGDDGSFRFPSVPVGSYQLTAGPGPQSTLNYTSASREQVRTGETALDIRLEAGLVITGRVSEPDRRPAAGLAVYASTNDPRLKFGGRQDRTDAEGRFALRGLPAGRYQVNVQGRGSYAPLMLSDVPAGTEDLELSLSEARTIDGQVLAPDGTPARGVNVLVQPMEGTAGQTGWSGTDGSGNFRVQNLPEGTYRVVVSAPGRYATRVVTNVAAGTSGLGIVLEEGLSIQGVLTDPDGRPAAETRLQVRPVVDPMQGNGTSFVDTNEEGKFAAKALAPGRYRLQIVGHPKGFILSPEPEVEAGKEGLALRAIRGLSVSGRVLDRSGRGVAEAWLMVEGLNQNWIQTDDSGAFTIPGLAPGEVKLRAWVNGVEMRRDVRAGESGVELRAD